VARREREEQRGTGGEKRRREGYCGVTHDAPSAVNERRRKRRESIKRKEPCGVLKVMLHTEHQNIPCPPSAGAAAAAAFSETAAMPSAAATARGRSTFAAPAAARSPAPAAARSPAPDTTRSPAPDAARSPAPAAAASSSVSSISERSGLKLTRNSAARSALLLDVSRALSISARSNPISTSRAIEGASSPLTPTPPAPSPPRPPPLPRTFSAAFRSWVNSKRRCRCPWLALRWPPRAAKGASCQMTRSSRIRAAASDEKAGGRGRHRARAQGGKLRQTQMAGELTHPEHC